MKMGIGISVWKEKLLNLNLRSDKVNVRSMHIY
jgi:hypothetical protein